MPAAEAQITHLTRFPLKGAQGEPLESVALTESGLEGDRLLGLQGPDGKHVNQLLFPELAQIQAFYLRDHVQLIIPWEGAVEIGLEDRDPDEVLEVYGSGAHVRTLSGEATTVVNRFL